MPTYSPVPEDRQLPEQAAVEPARKAAPKPVTITTEIPYLTRRRLTIALGIYDRKLKDVVTDALEDWLQSHPLPPDVEAAIRHEAAGKQPRK